MNAKRAALAVLFGLTSSAGSALADSAGHAAACAAALTEAQSLQHDFGIWRGEARVLAGHRKDPGGLPAKFKSMAEAHAKQWMPLSDRMAAANSGQFALHKDGACPEDAATAQALLTATRYMNMPDGPSVVPLPEGYCRNSPDLDAPLVLCSTKASP